MSFGKKNAKPVTVAQAFASSAVELRNAWQVTQDWTGARAIVTPSLRATVFNIASR